jgi:microcystin-dependent protein
MLKTAFETIQTINDSLSIIRSRTPVGSIIQFAGELLPTGFLLCDGSALLRSEYTDLFNVISVTWGSGDNSTTFNIPDLRNRFLRSSGTISGAVGTLQADSVKSHSHTSSLSAAGAHSHSATIYDGGSHGHSGSTGNAGNHSHQVPGVQNSILGNNSGFVFRAGMESVGNYTVNSTGNHAHSLNINEGGQHNHGIAINSDGAHSHSLTIDAFGDAETRPMSATVMYCIKF